MIGLGGGKSKFNDLTTTPHAYDKAWPTTSISEWRSKVGLSAGLEVAVDEETTDLVKVAADAATGGLTAVLASAMKWIGIRTAAQRLDEAVNQDFEDWVTDAVIGWKRFEEQWRAIPEQERPRPSDISAVLEAVQRVYRRTADRKKREVLRQAVINAFDPALYAEGLTLRLLRIVEELEYGDVAMLRRLAEADTGSMKAATIPRANEALDRHHLQQLRQAQLVLIPVARRAEDVLSGGNWDVRVAELGHRMLRLLAEPHQPDNQEALSASP
jgi:hypothetical protein